MIIRSSAVVFLLAAAPMLVPPVQAQEANTHGFPIRELGDCMSVEACADFCDGAVNWAVCGSYADEHDMNPAAPDAAYPVAELGACASLEACRSYCEAAANRAVCVDYALGQGWLSAHEAETARRALEQLAQGATPGGCATEPECNVYCRDLAHVAECLEFAHKIGGMTDEEYERAKGMGGVGPGGCRDQFSCETFCSTPEHSLTCVEFAIQHGLVPQEEAERARRFAEMGGQGPGGCTDGDSCRQVCERPENQASCMAFLHDMGEFTDEEYEVIQRVLAGEGPGGCNSEVTCNAYCGQQANMAECQSFFGAMMGGPQCGGTDGYDAPMCAQIPEVCKAQGFDMLACQTYCDSDQAACGGADGAGPDGQSCGGSSGYTNPGCSDIPPACQEQGFDGDQCNSYCTSNPSAGCGGSQSSTEAQTGGCGGTSGYPSPQCDGIPQACKDQQMDGNQCQQYCTQNPSASGCSQSGSGGCTGANCGTQSGTYSGSSTHQQGTSGGCGNGNGYPSPTCDGIAQACKDQDLDGNECQQYCSQNPSASGCSQNSDGTGGCSGPNCGTQSGSQSGTSTNQQGTSGSCGGSNGYPSPECDGIPQACRQYNYDGNQCNQYCQQNPSACGWGQSQSQSQTQTGTRFNDRRRRPLRPAAPTRSQAAGTGNAGLTQGAQLRASYSADFELLSPSLATPAVLATRPAR